MSGRRIITREDIKILKLRRKRKLINLTVGIVLTVVIVGAGVIYYLLSYEFDNAEAHENIATAGEVASSSDMTLDDGPEDTSGINDKQDVINYVHSASDSSDNVITTEEYDVTGIVFEVPETSLAAVEEIQGNNWADEARYVKSEDIADFSYFDYTLFVGDSRTEGIILYGGLPNLNGFCYKGLSVDKVDSEKKISIPGLKGKYTCYEAIEKTSYDNYYLMFGVNELGWVYVETFIEDFNKLIDYIYEVNPEATIYVQSILPVTRETSETDDIYKQDRINEYNEALLQMCQTRGDVIYLDIATSVMGSDGYLPEEATTDGVHCNADYCKRLVQYIRCNTYEKLN